MSCCGHGEAEQETLDEATDPWGVQVERVEVKDVRVPENLQRAMAAEAEAARNARAKVIAAEGEHKSSRALRHAAEVIMDSPAALQVSVSANCEPARPEQCTPCYCSSVTFKL